jgi:hypothetical protein
VDDVPRFSEHPGQQKPSVSGTNDQHGWCLLSAAEKTFPTTGSPHSLGGKLSRDGPTAPGQALSNATGHDRVIGFLVDKAAVPLTSDPEFTLPPRSYFAVASRRFTSRSTRGDPAHQLIAFVGGVTVELNR